MKGLGRNMADEEAQGVNQIKKVLDMKAGVEVLYDR
jgi:hypothetical protein